MGGEKRRNFATNCTNDTNKKEFFFLKFDSEAKTRQEKCNFGFSFAPFFDFGEKIAQLGGSQNQ